MREDFLRASADARSEAAELIDKARALPAADRGPLMDEADRLMRRAAEFNVLLNELAADRLGNVVAVLTGIAQEETARASSIRGSAEALLRKARSVAGMPPAGGAMPAAAVFAPVAEHGASAELFSPIQVGRPQGPFAAISDQPAPSGSAGRAPGVASEAPARAPVGTVARAPREAIDPNKTDADLAKLHPVMRKRVGELMAALEQAGVPMRVFEAHRTPERQRHLFQQGRTRAGKKVTEADAWGSYHQYGMAVDMIINRKGINPWEDKTPETKQWWGKYHALANEVGLEPVSFEKPHVQFVGMTINDLRAGQFPPDGDESWQTSLETAARRFPAGSPRLGAMVVHAERPPLPQLSGFDDLPPREPGDWTSFGDGMDYRIGPDGVLLRRSTTPLRSDGAPITASRIVELYGEQIAEASRRHQVPPELIVMTIAIEAAAFRPHDFTGERTFRWESGCMLSETGDPDIDGAKHRGDYSAGPMQVLSTTARWINRVKRLGHDPNRDFGWFKRKPGSAPKELGLYRAEIAIDIGAAFIAWNRETHNTGNDPILVAACYNAGSLKPSGANRWGLRAHGDHLDRAARWYGDACEVMALADR
jgi:peptidoglycan LD-endopeptidase CwlK